MPTRERILLAAIGLFADRGYTGTSIRDIAQAVDLSESAIYRHFRSKDTILDSLLAEFERRLYQPLPPHPDDPLETGFIHSLLVGLPRLLAQDPILVQCSRFLLGEVHHDKKIREFIVSRFVDRAQDFTMSMINERFPDSRELAASPEILSLVINSLRFGWLFGVLIQGDSLSEGLESLEEELKILSDFLDKAITVKKRDE